MLTSDKTKHNGRLQTKSLDFLAFVDPALIPLHLIQSPSLLVDVKNQDSRTWLTHALVGQDSVPCDSAFAITESQSIEPWHSAKKFQSSVAVLARPSQPQATDADAPRITEVLLYAEHGDPQPQRLPTPPLSSDIEDDNNAVDAASTTSVPVACFQCLLLSSDALYQPLASPISPLQPGEASFLEPVNASRKRLSDLFDDVSDRRKKARRQSGATTSNAASRASSVPQSIPQPALGISSMKQDTYEPSSFAGRTLVAEPNFIHPRRQSHELYPPSAASRPDNRRGLLERQTSSLSQVTTFNDTEHDSMESKNKQLVSRVTMAGMRLCGLQQKRANVPARQTSMPHAEAMETHSATRDGDSEQDLEYKVVYHQTYKGCLFAFVSMAAPLEDSRS